MITLHDFTVERIPGVAKTATVFGHTTDPGRLYCTYPTGITGPAYVDVAGTRTYGDMGGNWDYLGYPNIGQSREQVTFFLKINWDRVPTSLSTTPTQAIANRVFFYNGKSGYNRANWVIGSYARYLYYFHSATSANNTVGVVGIANGAGIDKYIIVKDNTLPTGQVTIYMNDRATSSISGNFPTTGTMGTPEVMLFEQGMQLSKVNRICTNEEIDAYFASDAVPSSNLEFSYMGGHEILPSIPRIYDSSVNGLHLYDYGQSGWPTPRMSVESTDSGFITPAFSVPITISTSAVAGAYTINIRRNRPNVPSSVSDAEKYDDASVVVTVSDIATVVKCGPSQDLRARV